MGNSRLSERRRIFCLTDRRINTADHAKKGGKITVLIIKNPIIVSDLGPISEHLSPCIKCNPLINNWLKAGGDSDRCFATFYICILFQGVWAGGVIWRFRVVDFPACSMFSLRVVFFSDLHLSFRPCATGLSVITS